MNVWCSFPLLDQPPKFIHELGSRPGIRKRLLCFLPASLPPALGKQRGPSPTPELQVLP